MALRHPGAVEDDAALMAEINTTPLVDVMLVLLIIFLITVPVVNSAVHVQLPREPSAALEAHARNAIVTVDAQGALYWFDQRLPDRQALARQLAVLAVQQPQPELHIRGDARADYATIGEVVHVAQELGIARIGFLTAPPGR